MFNLHARLGIDWQALMPCNVKMRGNGQQNYPTVKVNLNDTVLYTVVPVFYHCNQPKSLSNSAHKYVVSGKR